MAHSISMKHAIWSWQIFGHTKSIAWVLRSGRELTQTDRDWLADFVEGKVKLPPGKPPAAYLLNGYRTLAIEAAENEVRHRLAEARGVGSSPRGFTDRTIANVAAEYFESDWYGRDREGFEEALRTRLRRSKRRHSTTE
jgi:hypothetical protein